MTSLFAQWDPNALDYELLRFVHVLSAVVGVGSSFVWPVFERRARGRGPEVPLAVAEITGSAQLWLTTVPLVVVGLTGLGLTALADPDVWISFADPWLSGSMTLYLLGMGAALGFVLPTERQILAVRRAVSEGRREPALLDEIRPLERQRAVATGVVHLLFVIVLVLMVVKPGSSGAI